MKDRVSRTDIKDFWEQGPPMGFIGENYSYEDKSSFRYSLQDYMHAVFEFEKFACKKVLEIGCGAGIDIAKVGQIQC